MATITVRDLDDQIRDELRIRAAEHGRSMEAEVRAILTEAVTGRPRGHNALMDLYWATRDIGVDIPLEPRGVEGPRVDFSGPEFA